MCMHMCMHMHMCMRMCMHMHMCMHMCMYLLTTNLRLSHASLNSGTYSRKYEV